MTDQPLFWIAALACLVVLAILLVGVGGFAKGGEFNKKYANKIMWMRIGAQFVAVILIVVFVWVARQGA
ncbi:MAG: twin transmembrane helix small protein [Rubricella sp.]